MSAVRTQAQPEAKAAPVNRGRFQKGYDARRHKFTKEECSDGFWAAIESIAIRYPDAVINDGSHRHITANFMKWVTGRKVTIN
jgi:hypothetical protein